MAVELDLKEICNMSQHDFSWYTRAYPNFLKDDICDEYIRIYEKTLVEEKQKVFDTSVCVGPIGDHGFPVCPPGHCKCVRIHPMQFDVFSDLNSVVLGNFVNILDQYREDVQLHKSQWPEHFGWEELRMKRYLCDTDEQFHMHVDVSNIESAKRFLIMLIYLNDDFDAGETEFPLFGEKVYPTKGTLVMFPPFWTHKHAARPPKNGHAKYTLMTLLNYIS